MIKFAFDAPLATLVLAVPSSGIFPIRPGSTCLAQIQGIDTAEPVRFAAVEQFHVAKISLHEGLRIAPATVSGSRSGDPIRKAKAASKRPSVK